MTQKPAKTPGKNQAKAAKAVVKRAVVKSGGKPHRRGVNMAPAVKKEAKKNK